MEFWFQPCHERRIVNYHELAGRRSTYNMEMCPPTIALQATCFQHARSFTIKFQHARSFAISSLVKNAKSRLQDRTVSVSMSWCHCLRRQNNGLRVKQELIVEGCHARSPNQQLLKATVWLIGDNKRWDEQSLQHEAEHAYMCKVIGLRSRGGCTGYYNMYFEFCTPAGWIESYELT
jgi:hypothetical protein